MRIIFLNPAEDFHGLEVSGFLAQFTRKVGHTCTVMHASAISNYFHVHDVARCAAVQVCDANKA